LHVWVQVWVQKAEPHETGASGGNGSGDGGGGGSGGDGDCGGAGGGGNARRLPQSAQSDPIGQPTRANSAPGPPSANGKHT